MEIKKKYTLNRLCFQVISTISTRGTKLGRQAIFLTRVAWWGLLQIIVLILRLYLIEFQLNTDFH